MSRGRIRGGCVVFGGGSCTDESSGSHARWHLVHKRHKGASLRLGGGFRPAAGAPSGQAPLAHGERCPVCGGEFFCGGVGCKTDVGGYSRAQARVRRSRTSACQERGASVARVVREPCGRAEQPVLSGSARVWRRDAEGSQQQQQWTECFWDVRSEARVMGR